MGNKKIDKTLIFNSKVGMHLANLEKLTASGKTSAMEENLEQIKVLVAKIHHLLAANEKSKQDCMMKAVNGIPIIIQCLQNCSDQTVSEHLVKGLNELAQNPKRGRDMVMMGVIPPVLSCLTKCFNSYTSSTSLLVAIHELLNKLGPKDKRFCTRARLSGALGVNLGLIRNCSVSSNHLVTYLLLLRLLSANTINCQQLGRSGAVSCVIRLAAAANKKHAFLIRLTLEILINLGRSRANVKRMIGFSGVQIMLTIHSEWHTLDVRNKQLFLRKNALSLLKLMTGLKNGRRLLQESDGLRVLYLTSYACIGHSHLENLVQSTVSILRKCVPKQTLPLANLFSAYQYTLPTDSQSGAIKRQEQPSLETDVEDDDDDLDITEDENAISFLPASDVDPHNYLLMDADEDDTTPPNQGPNTTGVGSMAGGEGASASVQGMLYMNGPGSSSSAGGANIETGATGVNATEGGIAGANNEGGDVVDDDDDKEDDKMASDEMMYEGVFVRNRDDLESSYAHMCEEASSFIMRKNRLDGVSKSRASSHPTEVSQDGGTMASSLYKTLPSRDSLPSRFSNIFSIENSDMVVDEELAPLRYNPVPKSQPPRRLNRSNSEVSQSKVGLGVPVTKKRGTPVNNGSTHQGVSVLAANNLSSSTLMSRSLPRLSLNSQQTALRDRLMKSTKKTLLKAKSTSSCTDTITGSQLARQATFCSNPTNVSPWDQNGSSSSHNLTSTSNKSLVVSNGTSNSPGLENKDETRSRLDNAELPSPYDFPHRFVDVAWNTKGAVKFSKIPIPEVYGHLKSNVVEPYKEEKPIIARYKMYEDFERVLFPQSLIGATVYDLEEHISAANSASNHSHAAAANLKLGNSSTPTLIFASMFECGNLRKAMQVREREYDLILNTDTNSRSYTQWFYFEVSNMRANLEYRFNIVNFEKPNSQFNFGMQPLVYSVQDMLDSGVGRWVRSGFSVGYYKNQFIRNSSLTGGKKGCTYYTLTFSLTFTHTDDIVYVAYHYPFSYSMLMVHLDKLEKQSVEAGDVYFKRQSLCRTISGNDVPLLTITALYNKAAIASTTTAGPHSATTPTNSSLSHGSSLQTTLATSDQQSSVIDEDAAAAHYGSLPVIFLSSRVHPGESNSSWVMAGTLNFLLSEDARALREMYVFKIVPMLNPDGVINGNYRCSLTGQDLNRLWLSPSPELHPTIYHTKGLLHYLAVTGRKPFIYCDYHGHSRRKNIFMYGCSNALSWYAADLLKAEIEDQSYKSLPKMLSWCSPGFCMANCSFCVEKVKESTARVVVWRHLQVTRSYTMESTFSGFDQGPYRGTQVGTRELQEMGAKFVEAMAKQKLLYTEFKSTPRLPVTTPNDNSSSNGPPPYSPSLVAAEPRLLAQLSESSGGDTGTKSAAQNGVVGSAPPGDCDAYMKLLHATVVAGEDIKEQQALLKQHLSHSTQSSMPNTARLSSQTSPLVSADLPSDGPPRAENVLFKNYGLSLYSPYELRQFAATNEELRQRKLEEDLNRLRFTLRSPSFDHELCSSKDSGGGGGSDDNNNIQTTNITTTMTTAATNVNAEEGTNNNKDRVSPQTSSAISAAKRAASSSSAASSKKSSKRKGSAGATRLPGAGGATLTAAGVSSTSSAQVVAKATVVGVSSSSGGGGGRSSISPRQRSAVSSGVAVNWEPSSSAHGTPHPTKKTSAPAATVTIINPGSHSSELMMSHVSSVPPLRYSSVGRPSAAAQHSNNTAASAGPPQSSSTRTSTASPVNMKSSFKYTNSSSTSLSYVPNVTNSLSSKNNNSTSTAAAAASSSTGANGAAANSVLMSLDNFRANRLKNATKLNFDSHRQIHF